MTFHSIINEDEWAGRKQDCRGCRNRYVLLNNRHKKKKFKKNIVYACTFKETSWS